MFDHYDTKLDYVQYVHNMTDSEDLHGMCYNSLVSIVSTLQDENSIKHAIGCTSIELTQDGGLHAAKAQQHTQSVHGWLEECHVVQHPD